MISEKEIKSVIIRKSLHFLIALVPTLAGINYPFSVVVLCAGTVFYAFMESRRFSALLRLPLVFDVQNTRHAAADYIAHITVYASHRRDKQRFVLGPLTLGSGALGALLFFPPPAAAAAIYALAIGDGLAGLTGRVLGRLRPPFLQGKSIEGSLACFVATLVPTYLVTRSWPAALLCGITGMIVEALPLEDFDNLLLPLSVGLAASFIA